MIHDNLMRITELGWHIYPVSQYTKKTPYKGAKDDATLDHAIIERWCHDFPGCNWRVHPGKSRILTLDIDRASDLHDCDGFATMREYVQKYGPLPRGPRLKTGGSGGLVAFFRHSGQELRGGSGALGPGIDVSTVRGAASPTVPPSVHQVSGGRYEWLVPPWDAELPDIPQWVCEKLKPLPIPEFKPCEITDEKASRMMAYYANDIKNAPKGGSNRALYAAGVKAGKLVAAQKISYADALNTLRGAAYERIKPEKRGNIIPTIKSGLQGGMRLG